MKKRVGIIGGGASGLVAAIGAARNGAEVTVLGTSFNVNTYGDGQGRYCYSEQEAVRIEGTFTMRPRSVAVFSVRTY